MDYTNAFSLSVSMANSFFKAAIKSMELGNEQAALEAYVNARWWVEQSKEYQK